MRVDHESAVEHQQQRMAIGFRLGHDLAADVAGSAWPIVRHHLLAKAFAERVSDDAPAGVGHPTGRERYHQADGARRPGRLRPCIGRGAEERGKR